MEVTDGQVIRLFAQRVRNPENVQTFSFPTLMVLLARGVPIFFGGGGGEETGNC